MRTTEIDLMPCPHCGGKAVLETGAWLTDGGTVWGARVRCMHCSTRTDTVEATETRPRFLAMNEAARLWNNWRWVHK